MKFEKKNGKIKEVLSILNLIIAHQSCGVEFIKGPTLDSWHEILYINIISSQANLKRIKASVSSTPFKKYVSNGIKLQDSIWKVATTQQRISPKQQNKNIDIMLKHSHSFPEENFRCVWNNRSRTVDNLNGRCKSETFSHEFFIIWSCGVDYRPSWINS